MIKYVHIVLSESIEKIIIPLLCHLIIITISAPQCLSVLWYYTLYFTIVPKIHKPLATKKKKFSPSPAFSDVYALKCFQGKLAISVPYDRRFINKGRTTAESLNRSPKPEINFVFADRYGKKPTVCQFASPLSDDIHTKPEVKGG